MKHRIDKLVATKLICQHYREACIFKNHAQFYEGLANRKDDYFFLKKISNSIDSQLIIKHI